jgi:hypothetical protein
LPSATAISIGSRVGSRIHTKPTTNKSANSSASTSEYITTVGFSTSESEYHREPVGTSTAFLLHPQYNQFYHQFHHQLIHQSIHSNLECLSQTYPAKASAQRHRSMAVPKSSVAISQN